MGQGGRLPRLRIRGLRFVGDTATFENSDARLVGTFRLDPTPRPKNFDMTVDEGNRKWSGSAGIYELTGDTFRVCFAFPSNVRPDAFTTHPGSGRTLFVYRRAVLMVRADGSSVDDVGFGAQIGRNNLTSDGRVGQPTRSQKVFGSQLDSRTVPLFIGMTIPAPLLAQTKPSPHTDEVSAKMSWDFEADEPGRIAKGFTNEVGRWEVAKDGDNHVLAQQAKNDDPTFNDLLSP